MVNKYPGLARGPIDHYASSVINAIADEPIDMGSVVFTNATEPPSSEILPRILQINSTSIGERITGIAVAGDTDGVFGDGSASTNDSTRAANSQGKGVVVCIQGRCLARVDTAEGAVFIGNPLGPSTNGIKGTLAIADTSGTNVVARAQQSLSASSGVHIIAVKFDLEGFSP